MVRELSDGVRTQCAPGCATPAGRIHASCGLITFPGHTSAPRNAIRPHLTQIHPTVCAVPRRLGTPRRTLHGQRAPRRVKTHWEGRPRTTDYGLRTLGREQELLLAQDLIDSSRQQSIPGPHSHKDTFISSSPTPLLGGVPEGRGGFSHSPTTDNWQLTTDSQKP